MILSCYNMKIVPFCPVLVDPVTKHLRGEKKKTTKVHFYVLRQVCLSKVYVSEPFNGALRSLSS